MKLLTAFEFQDHDAHIAAHTAFMQSRMVQINPMVYALLQSHVSDHISFKAQQEVREQLAQDQNMMALRQQNPEQYQIAFDNAVATAVAEITEELVMGQKQDPLVMLKQRELDLRAMDLQRKADQDMISNEIRENEIDERLDIEKMKLENNEDQAAERIRIADAKVDIARKKVKK